MEIKVESHAGIKPLERMEVSSKPRLGSSDRAAMSLKSHSKRVSKKIEQDHYWYDHVSKQMWHERGGKMIFKWMDSHTRVWDHLGQFTYKAGLYPFVVDQKHSALENNYNEIVGWLEKNQDKFGISIISEVPDHRVEIEVSDKLKDDLTYELYRQQIMWD